MLGPGFFAPESMFFQFHAVSDCFTRLEIPAPGSMAYFR